MMRNTDMLALILGGGQGTRLFPLTKYRAKPAVPIAGKFRIIDIPISNCLNSRINKIYILTQFNTHSLHRHIYDTYRFGRFEKGFVDILAAQQTTENMNWYQGTADSVRQNLSYVQELNVTHTLILSGDHLYRMDYRHFLQTHIKARADITLSVKPVSAEEAVGFGILQTDADDRILRFVEKPSPALLPDLVSPGLPPETPFLASMGIYLFTAAVLPRLLAENPSPDFGKHIIPYAINKYVVFAHRFDGYWKDIGTIQSFFVSNLELVARKPPFSFYDEKAPFYTRPRFLPGSHMDKCRVKDTLVGSGCFIRECSLERVIVGNRTVIGAKTQIDNAVIMGADYFEDAPPRGVPPVGIGHHCLIHKAIIDKNARIGNYVRIVNAEGITELDRDAYSIRDGIVVVPKNAVIPDHTVI